MLTLVIFVVLVGMVMLGVPIFAAMGLTAAGTFILLGDAFVLPMMAQRMYVATTGFTLLAIPFFILAGQIMNRGGIARRLIDFAKAMLGMLKLRHGRVVLDGKDITGLTPQARVAEGIAFVPQTNNVFASMSVQENLEMGAYLRDDDISGAPRQSGHRHRRVATAQPRAATLPFSRATAPAQRSLPGRGRTLPRQEHGAVAAG